MHERIPPKLQTAINALLTQPAVCSSGLRQAVMDYAGQTTGDPNAACPIPTSLAPFIDKVSLNAYQVTDEDIEQLRTAGYSEDAIYELTLSAAVGASLARLECGLAALGGTGK